MHPEIFRYAIICTAALVLIGCTAPTAAPTETATPTDVPTPAPTLTTTPSPVPTISPELSTEPTESAAFAPDRLMLEVIAEYPHDNSSFTQGLLWANGLVYESSGQYGFSELREVNPDTGEVLRRVPIGETYFAEGIALVGDEIIMLTWNEQTALRFNLATFEGNGSFPYTGEGWGLCYDGTTLYHSDGSPAISLRDPQTFEYLSAIQVTLDGQPVEELNELECVGDSVYANVWHSSSIMQIDKTTGIVTAIIDASGLLMPEETPPNSDAVLNGIAYVPERDTFLLTGKLWPKMFEVRFVPSVD